jgi:hypothetical protein
VKGNIMKQLVVIISATIICITFAVASIISIQASAQTDVENQNLRELVMSLKTKVEDLEKPSWNRLVKYEDLTQSDAMCDPVKATELLCRQAAMRYCYRNNLGLARIIIEYGVNDVSLICIK